MKITKVKALNFYSIFWRRADPRKYFKLNEAHYSSDESAELLSLADIWDELVLVNPTQCDFCGGDLPGFPPLTECSECHRLNEDRECFEQTKEIVAWWSNSPDPGI